jgi:hypothetical protein
MIESREFSLITKKHMGNFIDDIDKQGGATANQWVDQIGVMVASLLMTVTDKIDMPREESMAYLTGKSLREIMKHVEFQLNFEKENNPESLR